MPYTVNLTKDTHNQVVAYMNAWAANYKREDILKSNYKLWKLLGGGTINYKKCRAGSWCGGKCPKCWTD